MGLNAIGAAARAAQPLATLALLAESSPRLADLTRSAGLRGWQGELVRRAGITDADDALRRLRWWPEAVVRDAVSVVDADYLAEVARIQWEVADAVLGSFAYLEGLVADLEWLAFHADLDGRPQLAAALSSPMPSAWPARAVALARALHWFRDDCTLRAWERLGVADALEALVIMDEASAPEVYGWSSDEVSAARDRVAAREVPSPDDVKAEADALAADPWETMTESRRTRALAVVEVAADRAGAIPGG